MKAFAQHRLGLRRGNPYGRFTLYTPPKPPTAVPSLGKSKLAPAILTIALGIMLFGSPAFAASSYAPNVNAQASHNVTVTGGSATQDDSSTTGVTVTINGLTGVTSANVTTQSLNAPNTGVSAFSTSGTAVYFDVHVVLPAGSTVPSGATVTVCFSDPLVTSSDTLNYWTGSSWAQASSVTVAGTQICGTVSLSALTGTNFVAAPAASSSTSFIIYGALAVLVIVVLGGAFLVMRRRKPSAKPTM
jgi:hypothetical protein